MQQRGDGKIRSGGSATGNRNAQPTVDGPGHAIHATRRCEHAGRIGGEDTHDTHLDDGECLVVQQLLLPQVIIQRSSGLLSILSDPIGGSGGYLLCDLEPLKVVFDESFEDERPQFKTSSAGEAIEGHSADGWALGNKKGEGTV